MPRIISKPAGQAAASTDQTEVATVPAPNKRRTKTTQKTRARVEHRRNVAPVSASGAHDAELHPQDKPRDMPSTGPARIDPLEIETVQDGPGLKDQTELLAFLNEEVEVIVLKTNDKNADPCPGFWVNGRSQYFPRGMRVKCKRLYLEKLARSVITSYTQEEYLDPAGNRAVRNIPSTSLAYPFSVAHDPNPRGSAWLENLLAEA